MERKYVKLYMKRNALLALGVAALCWLPLFIAGLLRDVLSYDIVVSIAPFLIAGICVLMTYIPTFRFRRMIREQEMLYHREFSDIRAKRLEDVLYLTDEWLIASGTCALYKNHIQMITERYSHQGRRYGGGSFIMKFTTVDSKQYAISVSSSDIVKKIHQWHRKNKEI